jgi:glycosyltransferase involved in cell wall biosynthesis
MRLVHISNGPLPYHTPILNALSKLVDLHVVYMSSGHPLTTFHDLWGTTPSFSHETFWSMPLGWNRTDFRVQISAGVSTKLRRLAPDTLLVSSWGPLVGEPLVWKTAARRRAVMWAESTGFSGLLRGRVSTSIRKMITAMTDAFVAESTSAAEYLKELGVEPARMIISCLPSPLVQASRTETGNATHSSGAPAYLFVGRLIPRKRPLELIRAFSAIAGQVPGASLTIVGEGPLEEAVAREARPMRDRIRLVRRREGEQLSEMYASADILVVPSVREVWGLVVNEGLAHGLFVIATDEVGSALDLVVEERNGTIVPADDDSALVSAMLRAARTVPLDSAARDRRRQTVDHCTPVAFANDIYRAARAAWGEKE